MNWYGITKIILRKFTFTETSHFLRKFYTTKIWSHTVLSCVRACVRVCGFACSCVCIWVCTICTSLHLWMCACIYVRVCSVTPQMVHCHNWFPRYMYDIFCWCRWSPEPSMADSGCERWSGHATNDPLYFTPTCNKWWMLACIRLVTRWLIMPQLFS